MNNFNVHITKEEKDFHKRITAVCHFRGIVEQSPGQEEYEKLFLIVHRLKGLRRAQVGAATTALSPTSSSEKMPFNTGH